MDSEVVAGFFDSRAESDSFADFTDSSRDWYLAILDASQVLRDRLQVAGNHILDLGCGRGFLYDWLGQRSEDPFTYHGVDISSGMVKAARAMHSGDVAFHVADAATCPPLYRKPDVIAAINVLPYIQDPARALAVWRVAAKRDTLLVVVDPSPSLYWEREFGGFGIKIRSMRSLRRALLAAGWTIHERATLSLSSIGRLEVGRLSHLIIATPSPNQTGNGGAP